MHTTVWADLFNMQGFYQSAATKCFLSVFFSKSVELAVVSLWRVLEERRKEQAVSRWEESILSSCVECLRLLTDCISWWHNPVSHVSGTPVSKRPRELWGPVPPVIRQGIQCRYSPQKTLQSCPVFSYTQRLIADTQLHKASPTFDSYSLKSVWLMWEGMKRLFCGSRFCKALDLKYK